MSTDRVASLSRMAVVTTSPYQVALFLEGHLKALPPHIQPVIFTNTRDSYAGLETKFPLQHIPIGRAHRITHNDVRAGLLVGRELRTQGVQSVVTMSPKGGFVGQVAARAAGVERRLHIFTGQVWQGMSPGPLREAVLLADRLIGHTATAVAADSQTQADHLRHFHIPRRGLHVTVPHPPGSIRGVDLKRFRPRDEVRHAFRESYGLREDTVAFIHLGRIAAAKGVPELIEAFAQVRTNWVHGLLSREPVLFLVGQDESGLTAGIAGQDGIHSIDFTDQPEEVLAGSDVLVLASHREGFGSSVIEAAAVGLPAIGTDIVGVRDAIVPGETGWLIPRRSPPYLRSALETVLRDPEETHRRGLAALRRARDNFDSTQVTAAWAGYLTAIHEGDSG